MTASYAVFTTRWINRFCTETLLQSCGAPGSHTLTEDTDGTGAHSITAADCQGSCRGVACDGNARPGPDASVSTATSIP